jgi:nucleoside-diphosphate-sugar epimerase
METILVTGATGFTGSYVVPMLLKLGYHMQCFVRHSSNTTVLAEHMVDWCYGDLADINSLVQAMKGSDILINVAYISSGYAPNIVRAAEIAGVKRALFVSSTSLFTTSSFKTPLLAAEACIRQSRLPSTILRPTMIYGSSRDRNMGRLIRHLQKWPVLPVFGNGNYLQQPVYVENLAWAIAHAAFSDHTIGKAYTISGADALTYNEVISTICRLLKRKVARIRLPITPCVFTLRLLEKRGFRLPIRAEQILRLNEDKAFDFDDAQRDFGYSPLPFAEGIAREISEMGYR